MNKNIVKSIIKLIIMLFFFILIFFIFFIYYILYNLNSDVHYKKYNNNLIEGLKTNTNSNVADAFCESHRGSSNVLQESCSKLTKRNCLSTSCCVYTSEDKCVAGNQDGPIFNSDEKGKTTNIDYYYKDKCFGPKCINTN
jgi:hypothetical protein